MMNYSKVIVFAVLALSFSFNSCQKVRNCECTTSWVDYTDWGPVDRYETVAYPVEGNKKDAKTQCDILRTNQNVGDAFYTECVLK